MRRIHVDAMFNIDAEGDAAWVAIKNYLKNKDLKNLEDSKSFIMYENCYHDKIPFMACELIERIENPD